jgi:hypothetical protein
MKVSLYVRVSSKGRRRYVPVNKKRIYPEGTVFCLRYARTWEILPAKHLGTALAARAGHPTPIGVAEVVQPEIKTRALARAL